LKFKVIRRRSVTVGVEDRDIVYYLKIIHTRQRKILTSSLITWWWFS